MADHKTSLSILPKTKVNLIIITIISFLITVMECDSSKWKLH